ncbi:hypothetical protein [Methanolobus halotolerans]|uniref:hypothetical protein n=1 Tax=Methanolobus halotolerans TaxID=2052935 RepID=UPI001436B488|nr:hypothetical protein [Methanolobus halotolerans]
MQRCLNLFEMTPEFAPFMGMPRSVNDMETAGRYAECVYDSIRGVHIALLPSESG